MMIVTAGLAGQAEDLLGDDIALDLRRAGVDGARAAFSETCHQVLLEAGSLPGSSARETGSGPCRPG